MKFSAPAGIAVFLLVWSFCPQVAIAGDAAPKATATRPAQEPATRPAQEPVGQSSLPNAAPPATTTQTTGSTNQDPQIKQMNEEGKAKIEKEGKLPKSNEGIRASVDRRRAVTALVGLADFRPRNHQS